MDMFGIFISDKFLGRISIKKEFEEKRGCGFKRGWAGRSMASKRSKNEITVLELKKDGNENRKHAKVQYRDDTSDLDWFASNPPELKDYFGMFVAISEKRVLGYGNNEKDARKMARKKDRYADLLIIKVSNDFIPILKCL